MTDRERYIKARKEARRYQRKYLALRNSKEELKQTIQDYLLKNELIIRAHYVDSCSGFIIETQKLIDAHFDKFTKGGTDEQT